MLDPTASVPQNAQGESSREGSPSTGADDMLALETIPSRYVEALNAFYRPSPSLKFQFADRNVRLSPTWMEEEPNIPNPYTISIKIDGQKAELVLPKSVLEIIFANLDPSIPFDDLTPDHRAIIFECAVSKQLSKLEADMDCSLSIVAVAKGRGRWTGSYLPLLPMVIQIQGLGIAWGLLRMEPAYLLRFARLISGTGEPKRSPLDAPAQICVRWASVRLSLDEIRSLNPGDIILVDHSCGQSGVAIAVIEEHMIVPVALTPNGYRVNGKLRLGQGSGVEWSCHDRKISSGDLDNSTLGDLPFDVFFEYGRLHSSLKEIRTLNTDHIYPLAKPLQNGLDIVVNDTLIGHGEITKIGQAVGVRVTRR